MTTPPRLIDVSVRSSNRPGVIGPLGNAAEAAGRPLVDALIARAPLRRASSRIYLRERAARLREEVPLEQVAAELDEAVAFLGDLHAFAHDEHPHVLAELGHGADELPLG